MILTSNFRNLVDLGFYSRLLIAYKVLVLLS